MMTDEHDQARLKRIEASRAALAARYAAEPASVERFNLRMSRLAAARKREAERVERVILGETLQQPPLPDMTRPAGLTRQEWKVERNRRMVEHRRSVEAWREARRRSDANGPSVQQMAKADFIEMDVNDCVNGHVKKIGRAYCRRPRFETIEGLTVEQLGALRRYRRAFDASELSPVKSGLDIGPGGGSGGSDGALVRIEKIAFATVAVDAIEQVVSPHLRPLLRAVALEDQDFKTIAGAMYGGASGPRREQARRDFLKAVDALVLAAAPPPSARPAPVPTVEQADPIEVDPAFLDDAGRMRPYADIARIIVARAADGDGMEIIRLPVGETAAKDVDCISLTPLPDGKADLTGSILAGEESMAIVGGKTYDSVEAAEAAGFAWAAENGVMKLYVSTAA